MTNELNDRERELVALGAAMGSNCVGCLEYHVPAAREAGITDSQISEALRIADQVRQVPARKVFDAGLRLLAKTPAFANGDTASPVATPTATTERGCCCG